MTKEQAINLIRRESRATTIEGLRDYLSYTYPDSHYINIDEFKDAVEVISDNEYTIEVVDTTSVRGMYSVDLEENLLYLDEYWN